MVQIADGINDANQSLKDSDAQVNPSGFIAYSENAQAFGRITDSSTKDLNALVHLIYFDVAVTASKESEVGGGLILSIASIGLGAEAKDSDKKSTASRLHFKIPMWSTQVKSRVRSQRFLSH